MSCIAHNAAHYLHHRQIKINKSLQSDKLKVKRLLYNQTVRNKLLYCDKKL